MAPTVENFNTILEEFLAKLSQTFPDDPEIKKYRTGFAIIKDSTPKKVMEAFVVSVNPYEKEIVARNESFFLNDLAILKELGIHKYWNDDLSDDTKNAIWEYFTILLMVGKQMVNVDAMPSKEEILQTF